MPVNLILTFTQCTRSALSTLPPSRSYSANFAYQAGQTPCNTPLIATSRQSLQVVDPGSAPAPQPVITTVQITFTDCDSPTSKASARISQISASANSEAIWSIDKASNATAVSLKRGQYAVVSYKVTATRGAPRVGYSVSGTVVVSPGAVTVGAQPSVRSVTLQLSSGGSGAATCSPPSSDGSVECKFDRVPFTVKGPATTPTGGTATAQAMLDNGQTVLTAPQQFDFTQALQGATAGALANLTDTFDRGDVVAARAAGVTVEWDSNSNSKPPSDDEAPVTLSDTRVFEYSLRIGGMRKCGGWTLWNTARLLPINSSQGAVTDRNSLLVEVQGCPQPLEATMGLFTTWEVIRGWDWLG